MAASRSAPGCSRRALLGAAAALFAPAGAVAQGASPGAAPWPATRLQRTLSLGLLSQADDARYAPEVLQHAYPDAPGGRSGPAAQLALNDGTVALQVAGWTATRLVEVQAPDAAGVPAALRRLQRQGVQHVVLELPAAGVAAAAAAEAGQGLILFNAAAPEDALRGVQCAAHLLHTLPSHAMQMDAIAQLLAARRWSRPLVLAGTTPQDALLRAAWQRSMRRHGLAPVAEKAFEPADDVRQLTAEADYDAVVVLDAQGRFAREVPYRTVLPRPVVGSNGVVAQAWSALYEHHGADELTRRFRRRTGRAMGSYDWATWVAARAAAAVASSFNKATVAQQLQALRQGAVGVDGYKGLRLAFRGWDGQLRQPLLLAHGNGVADVAPLEGFQHPGHVLDTLGIDAAETQCRAAS